MRRGRPSKYAPLTHYLAALPADAVRLTLAEIEAIIGVPLPSWEQQATFWGNSPHGTFAGRPWVRAGWRVVRTELHAQPPAVTFAKVAPL
jgi:hypothetical protein